MFNFKKSDQNNSKTIQNNDKIFFFKLMKKYVQIDHVFNGQVEIFDYIKSDKFNPSLPCSTK